MEHSQVTGDGAGSQRTQPHLTDGETEVWGASEELWAWSLSPKVVAVAVCGMEPGCSAQVHLQGWEYQGPGSRPECASWAHGVEPGEE